MIDVPLQMILAVEVPIWTRIHKLLFSAERKHMMQTLKKIYEDLICDEYRWSYYSCHKFLNCDTLCDKEKAYNFIKGYFEYGGKEALFNDPYLNRNAEIVKERAPHIISTYLLGIIIAESFGIDIEELDSNNVNFKYLWFLACLYHDIGYIYEKKRCCKHLKMLQEGGLGAIQEICNIKYLYSREFITYPKEYVNIYLSYRAKGLKKKTGSIDHGIVGGLLLYDRLRKSFETAWSKAYRLNKNVSREDFYYNGLHFSNKHYNYYAIAADAVIAHNIWLNTLNDYLSQEGKKPCKERKIKRNNIIAFILAIADTVEPIKRFNINSLDEIKLESLVNTGFRLLMPDLKDNTNYDYMIDLSNWVDVNVCREENGAFLITK